MDPSRPSNAGGASECVRTVSIAPPAREGIRLSQLRDLVDARLTDPGFTPIIVADETGLLRASGQEGRHP